MKGHSSWKNYIGALLITVGIFVVVVVLSNIVTNQKINSIKQAQDAVALNIMSSEARFSLMSDFSCATAAEPTSLEVELSSVEAQLNYSEVNSIGSQESLEALKKYYDLLEIKDFLLTQKINRYCGTTTNSILYFYSLTGNCDLCTKEGYVLSALREKYPNLRVYSFNYSTDLSALSSLLSIYHVSGAALPAIVIDGHAYTGFYSLNDVEALLPVIVPKKTPSHLSPKHAVIK